MSAFLTNSKLVKQLKQLSDNDLKEFGKYLKSRFGNRHSVLVDFQKILRNAHPEYQRKLLNKRKIYAALMSGNYNGRRLNDLISRLSKILEQFLVEDELKNNPILGKILLARGYKKRGADELFYSEVDKAITLHEIQEEKNYSFYSSLFNLKYNRYFYPATSKYELQIDSNLEGITELLEGQYLLARLRLVNESIMRQSIVNHYHSISDLDHLLAKARKMETQIPLIGMWRRITELSLKRNLVAYNEAKSFYNTYRELTNKTEQFGILASFINYGISQLNQGKEEYYREIFSLYANGVKWDILAEHGKVSPDHFNNIVNTACVVEEFEWLEYFLKVYTPMLPEEVRTDISNLSNASLYFFRGSKKLDDSKNGHKDLKNAIFLLQNVNYVDFSYNLRARSIVLRAYYELGEDQSLGDYIIAFRQYLKRNKTIAKNVVVANLNFLSFVRKLASTRLRDQELVDVEILRTQLSQLSPITYKSWLYKAITKIGMSQ